MWQLINHTPFAAQCCFTRDTTGVEYWGVAVRASFEFDAQGTLELARTQSPVKLVPQYMGDVTSTCLRYETDLPLCKRTTDVLLHATAYAPHGTPTRHMPVQMRIGSVHKQLHVWGDRTYNANLTTDPKPFVHMPIRYERTYGGLNPATQTRDARNPIGVFVSDTPERGARLPNIEPGDDIVDAAATWNRKTNGPGGFGPLPAHWSPRLELAGTYDHTWEIMRKPLAPADFDNEHYQCAPLDQRAPSWLLGGEPVVLAGLTPEGHTRFDLPHIGLALETRINQRIEAHPTYLHTVIIETDTRHLTLVWHSSLRCQGERHLLHHTTINQTSA